MKVNFLQTQTSRREMLRGSAIMAGSAFLAHLFPAPLLRASAAGNPREASSDALDWANQLLQTYSNRRAIVVSHFILNGGTGAGFGSQGQAIFDALSGNPNLFLLLSGHVTPITQGRRQDTIDGHTIYSLMSDYQSLANGGNGWLRIMQFTPSDDEIQVSTYSPVLDQFQTSSVGQFSLSYNMHSQVARRAPGKHKTYTAHVVRPVARARRPSLDFRAQP